ncbi:MAG: hypothetical protein WC322_05000 [Candidatus Paceibacterota bacterium]
MTVADQIDNEADLWRAMESSTAVTGVPECDRLIEAMLIMEDLGK